MCYLSVKIVYRFRIVVEMEYDQVIPLNNTTNEGGAIINEYVIIVQSLKQDLQNCKVEQAALRSELENIQDGNRAISIEAREAFTKIRPDDSGLESSSTTNEMISNYQKRIAIMQMEKESTFQLWQMALKAIDMLEEELKEYHRDGKGAKFYEEQINGVKESYSDAIKALEGKLLQARENFVKQQTLWDSSKEKIVVLTTEKEELTKKLSALRKEAEEKDSVVKIRIDNLNAELNASQSELEKTNDARLKLEGKLRDAQRFVADIIAKDNETKNKVSEAIELVESAVNEKENALRREARALEEKLALEKNMSEIIEGYKSSLDNELSKAKETYDRNLKKYSLDMKELKVELQQKSTLLDRAQRECRLVEEELEKIRHGSDDFVHHSNSKFLALQQQLEEAEYKLQSNEETCRKKYSSKIEQLKEQVNELEEKLVATNEQLKRVQKQFSREVEDRVREADDRTKEAVERYANLERRLARAIDERENLTVELRLSQGNFERETKRKDQDRRFLENRIRELQEDVRTAASSREQTAAHENLLASQINILELELKKRSGIDKLSCDSEHRCKTELAERTKIIQEKCEKRIKELTQHVETHQRLSNKWKEEAKRITASFQKRLKELRAKVIALRKENEELNKELLASRHQLTQFREKIIHRYDHGDTLR